MKLSFFSHQDRKTRLQESNLATLKDLLEASQSDASPEEKLAQLMALGNRELWGEQYATLQQQSKELQPVDPSEPEDLAADEVVSELSTADLAGLLGASDTADSSQESTPAPGEEL